MAAAVFNADAPRRRCRFVIPRSPSKSFVVAQALSPAIYPATLIRNTVPAPSRILPVPPRSVFLTALFPR